MSLPALQMVTDCLRASFSSAFQVAMRSCDGHNVGLPELLIQYSPAILAFFALLSFSYSVILEDAKRTRLRYCFSENGADGLIRKAALQIRNVGRSTANGVLVYMSPLGKSDEGFVYPVQVDTDERNQRTMEPHAAIVRLRTLHPGDLAIIRLKWFGGPEKFNEIPGEHFRISYAFGASGMRRIWTRVRPEARPREHRIVFAGRVLGSFFGRLSRTVLQFTYNDTDDNDVRRTSLEDDRGVQVTMLNELQNNLVDPSADISSILRKALIMASRLGDKGLVDWLKCELDGYGKDIETPDYRQFHSESYGHFSGPFGRSISNAPIPLLSLPDEVREALSTIHIRHGASQLAEMIRSASSGVLHVPWPADLVAFVANTSQLYEGMNLLSAYRILPASSLQGALEAIRNKLLEIALELEKLDPSAGSVAGQQRISPETVSTIYQTIIHGDVGVLSSGSGDVSTSGVHQIRVGDAKALNEFMESVGLSEEELLKFKQAIDKDARLASGKRGKGVLEWLDWMALRIREGVSSVAWSLLVDAIRKYVGF
jgi:hypothetical protein